MIGFEPHCHLVNPQKALQFLTHLLAKCRDPNCRKNYKPLVNFEHAESLVTV